MNWRIAQAKQKFSELINAALQEPQRIYNRDRLVAVVIEAKVFEEFLSWQQNKGKVSLADAFTELHQIAAEEDYTLEISPRQDRSNSFADVLNDVSV